MHVPGTLMPTSPSPFCATPDMANPIDVDAVRRARMASMLLADAEQRTPLEVVRWFGALQAQDAASGHWSLGVRCSGSTEHAVLAAFERGDIVRT